MSSLHGRCCPRLDNDRMDFERKLPTEQQDIADIVAGILAVQARFARQQRRPLGRGTHTKGVCARATLEIFDVAKTAGNPALAARLGARAVCETGNLRRDRPLRERRVHVPGRLQARRPRAVVFPRPAGRRRRSGRDAARLLDEQRLDLPDQRRARVRRVHAGRRGRTGSSGISARCCRSRSRISRASSRPRAGASSSSTGRSARTSRRATGATSRSCTARTRR